VELIFIILCAPTGARTQVRAPNRPQFKPAASSKGRTATSKRSRKRERDAQCQISSESDVANSENESDVDEARLREIKQLLGKQVEFVGIDTNGSTFSCGTGTVQNEPPNLRYAPPGVDVETVVVQDIVPDVRSTYAKYNHCSKNKQILMDLDGRSLKCVYNAAKQKEPVYAHYRILRLHEEELTGDEDDDSSQPSQSSQRKKPKKSKSKARKK
jgi:hypothetical protein